MRVSPIVKSGRRRAKIATALLKASGLAFLHSLAKKEQPCSLDNRDLDKNCRQYRLKKRKTCQAQKSPGVPLVSWCSCPESQVHLVQGGINECAGSIPGVSRLFLGDLQSRFGSEGVCLSKSPKDGLTQAETLGLNRVPIMNSEQAFRR